jgi:hypothetical protein
MAKKPVGAKVWIIPDSYLPDQSTGELKSHESACVLNLKSRPAKVKLTVYFEDRKPLGGFEVTCPPLRTVESDVDVVVQHTRLDTTQPALALMTTMAFPLR